MLKNKNIVLCVTGGIAAFKAASLASFLTQRSANVFVVMTKNATEFVSPLTFKSITHNRVTIDMFDDTDFIPHISLSDLADIVIVAPATANIIAKAANGIADDMTSTMLLSTEATKIIVPSMNTRMYDNNITQRNIAILKENDYHIMDPDSGFLACGQEGKGRFPAIEKIYGFIIQNLGESTSFFNNKQIVIPMGGTIEDIDPVRYISNRSSGKTGIVFAEEFIKRGGKVKIIAGNVSPLLLEEFHKTYYYTEIINVRSAAQMKEEIMKSGHFDLLFMCAAVADFRPVYSEEKIKKSDDTLTIRLEKNEDILQSLVKGSDTLYVGFAAETQKLLHYAREKLTKKGLDFIIANEVKGEKSAIGGDKSEISLLNRWNEEIKTFDYNLKKKNSVRILDALEMLIEKYYKKQ